MRCFTDRTRPPLNFVAHSFQWGNPFPSSANPGSTGVRRRRRRRALLDFAGVTHDNDTVKVYCNAAACDLASSVSSLQGDMFDSVNSKVLAGWDSFAQILFWMAVIFVAVFLLHMLALFVIWPRYLPASPIPPFLVFPRIEIMVMLVGFTGTCSACAAAIGTYRPTGITAGTIILWAYPVAFLVRTFNALYNAYNAFATYAAIPRTSARPLPARPHAPFPFPCASSVLPQHHLIK